MITFRGRISVPTLDAKKFSDNLQKEMEAQIRQAARAWLRAVIPKVPVWAGTAQGSLKPLAQFLRVSLIISPRVVRPGLGPSVGAAKGGFNFTRVGQRYNFRFKTDVAHFLANEYNDMSSVKPNLIAPTPWDAFLAGKAAFDSYVKNTLPKRLPRVKDYINYKKISIRLEP